jgi:hypothetical protein
MKKSKGGSRMFRVLEWGVMVALPAGSAALLTVGFILHLTGRLGPALHLIAPPRWADRHPAREN